MWPDTLLSDTAYELPATGTTLLGYVARRMHKTYLLNAAATSADPALKLAYVALYSLAASVSFGPAHYQPQFNRVGERVSVTDPETQAEVHVELLATRPHLRVGYQATVPQVGVFSGVEDILGTTVGLSGLGMPAPSRFRFVADTYQADALGTLTSELHGFMLGGSRIRGYGDLDLRDSLGQTARATLDRQGRIIIHVAERTWRARLISG